MACTYPVTVNSDPQCILRAFIDSGYYSLLNGSQRAAAQADPVGWLRLHPYLYNVYPTFFAQAATSGTTSPSSLQDLFMQMDAINQMQSGNAQTQGTPNPLIISTSDTGDSVQVDQADASAQPSAGSGVMGFISRYWLWIVVGIVAIIAIWYVVRR